MSLEEQKSKINTQAASSGLRTVGNTVVGEGVTSEVQSMYERTAEGRKERIVRLVCVRRERERERERENL
jgi:hypothetical protein